MPKKPLPHLRADFPVYAEKCQNCDDPQAEHMEVAAGTLTGRMVKCRVEGCGCDRWVSTWKEGTG